MVKPTSQFYKKLKGKCILKNSVVSSEVCFEEKGVVIIFLSTNE